MIGGAIWLFSWSIGLFVINCVVLYFGVKYRKAGLESMMQAEKAVKEIEFETNLQFNKLATLPPAEFHSYMTAVYSKVLELVNDRIINKNDPNAKIELFAHSSADMIEFLGPQTCSAIDYYYGEGYLMRWLRQTFDLLEKRGSIGNLIQEKSTKSDTLTKNL